MLKAILASLLSGNLHTTLYEIGSSVFSATEECWYIWNQNYKTKKVGWNPIYLLMQTGSYYFKAQMQTIKFLPNYIQKLPCYYCNFVNSLIHPEHEEGIAAAKKILELMK